jgi:hypothetical protein
MGQTFGFMKSSTEQETKLIQPVQEVQPVQAVQSVQPIQPIQPVQPVQAVQPVPVAQATQYLPTQYSPTQYSPTQYPPAQYSPTQYPPAQATLPIQTPMPNLNSKISSTLLNSSQKAITVSQQNLPTMNIYNNPLQQNFIIVNQIALKNCILSTRPNLSNINNCILSNIKGTNSIDDYTIKIVNLMPNNSAGVSTELTQEEITNLTGSNFTAYDINNSTGFNNIKINLVGLQQSISSGMLDVNTSIINNIYGLDSTTNQFKPVSLIASNYTINSAGHLILSPNYQQFQLINNYQDSNQTKTIILIVCIVLYLIIIIRK